MLQAYIYGISMLQAYICDISMLQAFIYGISMLQAYIYGISMLQACDSDCAVCNSAMLMLVCVYICVCYTLITRSVKSALKILRTQLRGGLYMKPPKSEHIFVAVITFFPFLLCRYF